MTLLGNKLGGEILCRELLCGKRYFAEVLMRTPLGIPLISYVGELMNSAGGRKNFAEDNLSVAIS